MALKITAKQKQTLLENDKEYYLDHRPVVKIFNPCGAATWLLTSMDPHGVAYGLCDLGMGSPELGSVSVHELAEVKGPLGIGLEVDRFFTADKTISQYAAAARAAGSIAA